MSGEAARFDVVLIGSGLGATACAYALAQAGKRVAFVPGVGTSRSLDADGGLILPEVVEKAFGPRAPLGSLVRQQQHFTAPSVESSPAFDDIEEMPERATYNRLELETWARDRATTAGAECYSDFVEGRVLPLEGQGLKLTEEGGDRELRADLVGLCEGSDPRIAMRVGLRPDYGPEDQLHFAKTIIARPPDNAVYRTGETRTRWGMPIQVSIVPLGSRMQVSVVARIENIMRSSHSSRDALEDLLASPLGEKLGLTGARLHTGVELIAMRPDSRNLEWSRGGMLFGVDASGVLDPREIRRAEVTIQGGTRLAASMLEEESEASWIARVRPFVDIAGANEPRWHDSGATGFLEEGPGQTGIKGVIGRIGRGVRRRRHGK